MTTIPVLIATGIASAANLVVNECLANEPGSATSLEWVELLNWPDTGNGFINLNGYRLVDGRDTTRFDTSVSIPPGGFVILARKPTGTGSFESVWGDSSGVWGDSPGESFPLLAAKISLRNSNDTVTLISPTSDTSRMLWSHDAGDGISIERIRPNRDDSPANFAFCRDPANSTPGRVNSVIPIRGDLSLDSLRVLPADPKWGDTLSIVAYVTNAGLGTVASARMELFDDINPSQTGDSLRPIDSISIPALDELTSTSLIVKWVSQSPGPHGIVARIAGDSNSGNDTALADVIVQFSQPLVIITEFLANPTIGGPDEWIEISNRATFPINLTGARIGDSSGTSPLPDGTGLIGPGEYWMLAENELAFRAHYPAFAGHLLPIANWHELNNTGDRIRMIGAAGEMIDSTSFRMTFDNNRSVERTDLSPVLASVDWWKPSADPSGSTPGKPNSVFPVYHDLSLDSMILSSIDPQWGKPVEIKLHLTSTGLEATSGLAVDVFEDTDLFHPGGQLEWIKAVDIPLLQKGERSTVSIDWSDAPPGIHRLVGRVKADGDSLNNSSALVVTIRHTQPLVIISEFLANPTNDGPGEWVEISNQAGIQISMAATKLGDSSDASPLPPKAGHLSPGEFWVLCESEAAFRRFYSSFNGTLIEIPHWRELNNGGDQICLYGAAGEIIDSFTYRSVYNANHSAERSELSATLAGSGDWTESVDPTGATPGRENSVKRALAGTFHVAVTPNPVYLTSSQPARIDYRLPIGEQLTLKIFDRSGQLVRTIADRTPSATGSVEWNGTDSRGAMVRPGPYILLARSDPQGVSQKLVIVVGP